MFIHLFLCLLPATCTDHPQKLDTCALATKRCHCEENRYEMYTYCKRSCGYCGQERLRKYDNCRVSKYSIGAAQHLFNSATT